MTSRINLRSALGAGLLGLALVTAGCSSNTDPTSWEEAEEDGNKIQLNFETACGEANEGANGDGDVPAYCECAYLEVREFYADDFDGFKKAESDLRADPEAINNSAVISSKVTDALYACALQHLG